MYSATVKDALQCPNETTFFKWAAVYHNISTILSELKVGIYSVKGEWKNENYRFLLCELEDGSFREFDFATLVRKRRPFF